MHGVKLKASPTNVGRPNWELKTKSQAILLLIIIIIIKCF